MPDARDPMEMAAREIAKTNIPAYADDKIWAADSPMYLRRAARRDLSGVDNPIATARAGVLAFLDADQVTAAIATAIARSAGKSISETCAAVEDALRALAQEKKDA